MIDNDLQVNLILGVGKQAAAIILDLLARVEQLEGAKPERPTPAPVTDRERHLEALLRRVREPGSLLPYALAHDIDAALNQTPDEGEAD